MGVFRVPIEIGDPQGERFERVEALVDTGATYSVLPASLLRGLGVEPHVDAPFELADGSIRNYQVGETRIRIDGQEATTLVVFGDEATSPLLGAYALEGLLLAVDPARGRLIAVPGRLM